MTVTLNRNKSGCLDKPLGHYLRQVVLPALAPVDHEVGQPLFPLLHFLFAKGLDKHMKLMRPQLSNYWLNHSQTFSLCK